MVGKLLSNSQPHTLLPPSLGVRTRAQTLALLRLHNSSAAAEPLHEPSSEDYLQLRSRRLQRTVTDTRRQRQKQSRLLNPNPNPSLVLAPDSPLPVPVEDAGGEDNYESQDDEIEASTGDSALDFEGGGSSNSTECIASSRNSGDSSSSESEVILAPRPPTAQEIDDFLTAAENELNLKDDFIAKYNFDPVNETPLPGRYEWVKVNP